MSSLWTPGGEVPVGRDRPTTSEPPPSGAPPGDEPGAPPMDPSAEEAQAQLQRYLLEAPAEEVVVQHAMGMYELAVLHLSQPDPDLGAARLAIDALAALLDGLQGRLGGAEGQLRQVLPQLRMAFVEVSDRAAGGGTGTGDDAPSPG